MLNERRDPGELVDEYREGWKAGFFDGCGEIVSDLYSAKNANHELVALGIDRALLRRMGNKPPSVEGWTRLKRDGHKRGFGEGMAWACRLAERHTSSPAFREHFEGKPELDAALVAVMGMVEREYPPAEWGLGSLHLQAMARGTLQERSG